MKNIKPLTRIKIAVLVLICCLQIIFPVYTAYASADWPVLTEEIPALSGIVIDADSGAVLYEKDADTLYPPASTAKILTALVVLENYRNMDDVITFSREAVERVESDSGNKISVSEGDQLTVEDCLYALILYSSNQTANALAEYIAGDIDSFVEMMNNKVKELGLTSSHFENPSGLNGDTQNVTSRELALIAKAAYDNPKLLEISKALSYKLPALQRMPDGQTINNGHRLVNTTDESSPYFYPPAVAGKTGFLIKAGNTLVTYAEQDGRRLISVVLKGQSHQYFLDAKTMLEFGFSNFENHTISEPELKSFSVTELEYLKGQGTDSSALSVSGSMVLTLPKNTSLKSVQRNVTSLPSGKHPDQAVAVLEYIYQGKVVGNVYITDMNEQPPANPLPESHSPAESQAVETEAAIDDSTPDTEPAKKGNPLFVFFIVIIILITGGLAGLFYYQQQKEIQRMKERQKKRRMRLEEMGISQEEFEQMKNSRRR